MRFLDLFLVHCLLVDSPPDTPQEIGALARNQQRVATRGREPGLRLERGDAAVTLSEWGAEILAELGPIARRLDALHGGTDYRDALSAATAMLREPDTAPSARVLAAMARDFDCAYVGFIRAQSLQTRGALLARPFAQEAQARLAAESKASITEQKRIEAGDSLPFEIYRQQYISAERLGVPGHRSPARV
jgi:glutamate--cysteine ligase